MSTKVNGETKGGRSFGLRSAVLEAACHLEHVAPQSDRCWPSEMLSGGGGALHTCSLSLPHHLEDTKHLLDPSLSDWTFVISLQLTPRSEAECFNSEAVSDTVCLYLKGQYCPAFGLADDKIKRKKLWAGRSNDAATKQSVKLSIKTGNNKLPCF